MTTEMLSHLVVGAILLFFGRRVFWLFVGAVGFLSGFELAEQLFGVEPGWTAVVVGLLVGGAAAMLAMFFQLVAAGIAGFGVGFYAALELAGPGAPAWLAALCGAAGSLLAVVLFGWALVVLSALAGAAALLDPFDLASGARLIGFVVLAGVGIGVQAVGMERGEARRR